VKRLVVAAAVLAAISLGGAASAADTAATTATAHPELLLTTPYPAVSTQPASTIKLDLKAYAPQTQPVNLVVQGTPPGWSAILRGGGFVIAGLTADPDDPGTAQLEIQVPPDAQPGVYTLQVVESDGAASSSLPVTVTVAKVVEAGIGITADFPSLKGAPTDTFTYTLTVTNDTPTSQAFTFAPQGPQGWTVNASPQAEQRAATLTIDGGANAKLEVTATPPPSVAEDTYPIGVTVTAANGATGQIQLQAEVTGTGTLDLATASGRVDVSGHSNHVTKETLALTNSGTAALTDIKMASAPPKGWEVTFEPATVATLKPGQTGQVVAEIKPAKNAVAGDYPLSLSASAGSSSKSVDLRYRVTSASWLGVLGVVVIIAAFGVLALAFRRFGRR
jgi:uncharacterized membrane protein